MISNRFCRAALIGWTLICAGAEGQAAASSSSAGAQEVSAAGEIALDYLEAEHLALGLSATDVARARISDQRYSTPSGVTYVYLRQTHAGIPVLQGVLNVAIGADNRVIGAANRFVPDLDGRAVGAEPSVAAITGVERAALALGLPLTAAVEVVEPASGAEQRTILRAAGLSRRDIEAGLVYALGRDRELRLAWNFGIDVPGGAHYWQVQVDASTGEVLRKTDLVERASYRVFDLPVESPSHATPPSPGDGRVLVVDPEDPAASPAGWHTSNLTQGPNVVAQTDLDGDDLPGPGETIPDGGAGMEFDFPLDLDLTPDSYRESAVTNLFYWNNVLHDLHYHYGFDDAAGNFQDSDPVLADVQDGSGTNSATMLTLPDGASPRMQMFVWAPSDELLITSPVAIEGSYSAGSAAFGAPLTATGVGGEIESVDDGGAAPSEGCGALTGFTPGNIALIDSGGCEFGTKVLNAEAAGAAAAVVVNTQGDGVFEMPAGEDGDSVTISSILIGLSDGDTVKSQLASPVQATLRRVPLPDRDGSFDVGAIIHEYGHGVSNRLTGGPSEHLCLQGPQSEAVGEGFSDFWALALTDDGSDVVNLGASARGLGTYLGFQDTDGPGLRPIPYSTDPTINPLLYSDFAGFSDAHGAGTVWASALWDIYWNLIEIHGFDPDLTHGTGGNNIALHLVMEALKWQPCYPTILDARDAIDFADFRLYDRENECAIWEAFAKRGMGTRAYDGGGYDSYGVTDDFHLPYRCVGEPFFAVDDTVVTARNNTIAFNVTYNDYGDGLDVVGFTQPGHGTVEEVTQGYSGNDFRYDPDTTFVGTDTFEYTLQDQNGDTDVGLVTVTVECDSSQIDFVDGFDPVPQAGWVVETPVNDDPLAFPWQAQTDPQAVSSPNSFSTSAAIALKDDRLISPPQAIAAATDLKFWHRFDVESGFDGGVLEVSTDGGASWQDVAAAGGVFLNGGYTGTITTGTGSPIAGRSAWTGTYSAMYQVHVDLNALAGETALFRWRAAFDESFEAIGGGWWVDQVGFYDLDDPTGDCNVFPNALDDEVTTEINLPVTIDVLGNDNDPDGDLLILSAVTSPSAQGGIVTVDDNGTATRADDQATYTPPADFVGADTFTYTIGDGNGGRDTATVRVTVDQQSFLTPCTEPLFSDGFESGDLGQWSSTMNPSGLSVDGAWLLEGAFGLGATVAASQSAVIDTTPGGVDHFCWSFLFDPSATVIPDGTVLKMGGARGTDLARMLDMALTSQGGTYRIGLKALQNNGNFAKMPFADLLAGPNLIEGEWIRSPGGPAGVLRLYVNGVLAAEKTNIANDLTPALNWWGMGMMGLYKSGMSGTLIFDSFESRTDP